MLRVRHVIRAPLPNGTAIAAGRRWSGEEADLLTDTEFELRRRTPLGHDLAPDCGRRRDP
jgi:hypothetical protein